MRLFVFVGLCWLGLTGCANIPLSTMLHFAQYDHTDVATVQPTELSAKVQLDHPYQLSVQHIKLKLDVTDNKGLRQYQFPLTLEQLEIITVKPNWLAGFGATPSQRNQYQFRLSEQGIAQFTQLQQQLAMAKPDSVGIGIHLKFSNLPQTVNKVTTSVLIRLAKLEDYILLIDNAELDIIRNP